MSALYAHCHITKQAHYQSRQRQAQLDERQTVVVGLILQLRQLHPVMGLRTIYALTQPKGLGREVLENAPIERVNGTIKHQYMLPWASQNLAELRLNVERAVGTATTHRPHSALGGLTPTGLDEQLPGMALAARPQQVMWTYQGEPASGSGQLPLVF